MIALLQGWAFDAYAVGLMASFGAGALTARFVARSGDPTMGAAGSGTAPEGDA